ncbi:hypothetical protein [Achromobacter kerstersii]|uniref:hypothetical protein n=1 Tax=Achromobacter kerstersii TaxID=1353890 RepID=UPI00320B20BC
MLTLKDWDTIQPTLFGGSMKDRKSGELGHIGTPIYWACAGAGSVIASQLVTGWAIPAGQTGWWEIVAAFGTVGAVIAAIVQASASNRRMEKERSQRATLMLLAMHDELSRLRSLLLNVLVQLENLHIGAQRAYLDFNPHKSRRTTLNILRRAIEVLNAERIKPYWDDLHLLQDDLGVDVLVLDATLKKVVPWFTVLTERDDEWSDLNQVLILSPLAIEELAKAGVLVCRVLTEIEPEAKSAKHFTDFVRKLNERLAEMERLEDQGMLDGERVLDGSSIENVASQTRSPRSRR